MTFAARINLQKGIPENKSFDQTNYSVECPLDAYIYHKSRMKHEMIQQHRKEQQDKALQEYLNKVVQDKLQECLDKSLTAALKGLK